MISLLSIIIELGYLYFIKPNSYFLPLFTLSSIIFLNKNKYYLLKCFLLGILYDLVFTNLFVLNGIIYFIIGLLINKTKNSFINNLLIEIVIIILYQLLLFLIFNIFKYQFYSINELLFILPHYFAINIIYILIITIIKHKFK